MSNTLRSYTSISSAANLGHFRETERQRDDRASAAINVLYNPYCFSPTQDMFIYKLDT